MHKLLIDYQLEFRGPWHIGTGQGRGLIDQAIRSQWTHLGAGRGEYRPVIPGSTIKGLLRTNCERIAQVFDLAWIDPHDDSASSLSAFVPHRSSPYIVNRLFGSRFAGDCLYISDAFWEGDYYEPLHRQSITRASIDRATNTAKQGHLFTSENIIGGTFKGRIEAYHQEDDLQKDLELPFEYILLLLGLTAISQIGGQRSIGWGLVQPEILNVTYNDQAITEEMWRDPEVVELLEIWDGGAE